MLSLPETNVMRNDKPEWLIPASNIETEEDAWLYDIDIKILLLEARGCEQKEISIILDRSEKTIKNHIERINEQTGCHNPQGRVGWAFENEVLIVVKNCNVISPRYKKKESEWE